MSSNQVPALQHDPDYAIHVPPSRLRSVLRLVGKLLPGNYWKTTFYLNCIDAPRRLLRRALTDFYRMDHVYAVLREAKARYKGSFSILEFGTSDGYAFTKTLYATTYLSMADRVTVHTFDTFEGMPPASDPRDRNLVVQDDWVEGQFRGRYEELEAYCRQRYRNYRIHKGYFEETLTDDLLSSLRTQLPILIWFDCDYYTSARTAFERLLRHIPNGCVIYFDEYGFNFGSRFTGEARLVYEINHGLFGPDVELVPDPELSLNSRRVYRFIRAEPELRYTPLVITNWAAQVHRRSGDSPLP